MISFFFQNQTIIALQVAVLSCFFFWVGIYNKLLWIRIFALSLYTGAVVIVLLLQSRTALLGLTGGTFFILFPLIGKKIGRKKTALTMIAIFLIAAALMTILIKTGSSSGRWFIWKRSFELWRSHWLSGTGFGTFNTAFNHIQADHFSHTTLNSKEAMLAYDGYFAFNEWLQFAIETGIAGLLLSLLLTGITLKACFKNNSGPKSWAAAMLICIFIEAFFSYPFHNLPLLLFSVFLVTYIVVGNDLVNKKFLLSLRAVVIVLLTGIFIVTAYRSYKIQDQFSRTRTLYKEGYRNEALKAAATIDTRMKKDHDFNFFYLQLLYNMNDKEEMIRRFDIIHCYCCDVRIHSLMANCYEEYGDPKKAEEHYLLSLYITPSLLESRMQLAEFYNRQNKIGEARYWANEALHFPAKVQSEKVEAIRKKAKDYLILTSGNK